MARTNYINRLQDENANLKQQLEAYQNGLNDLTGYVLSPKFRSGDSLDNYVNVNDVLARVSNIEQAVADVAIA